MTELKLAPTSMTDRFTRTRGGIDVARPTILLGSNPVGTSVHELSLFEKQLQNDQLFGVDLRVVRGPNSTDLRAFVSDPEVVISVLRNAESDQGDPEWTDITDESPQLDSELRNMQIDGIGSDLRTKDSKTYSYQSYVKITKGPESRILKIGVTGQESPVRSVIDCSIAEGTFPPSKKPVN